MMDAIQNVLTIFEQLSSVPRGSGREAQISRWLQERAAARGFPCKTDDAGNLVILVPAAPGYESSPSIILQGHMDMVCEKTPESSHNFLTDPIRCIVEGDWLHADRTTLGADNGIAIAFALALAEDPTVARPALELLFTVEEEVGLGGANLLQPGFIKSRILVNLDSEEEGTFIVGCAGGQPTHMRLPLSFEAPVFTTAFQLTVSGLRGGHSGVDIHRHYASANKLLARALARLQKITPLALINLDGGTAHNAISRRAQASFAFAAEQMAAIQRSVSEFEAILNSEYSAAESAITLTLSPSQPGRAASTADTARAIRLLAALPHGVAEMSASVEGFVETSNNLARVEIVEDALRVVTSQRSTVMSRLEELTSRISAVGLLAGAEVSSTPAYPGWQPDMKSALLQRSIETYRALFGVSPVVGMIHGGLECGTIGAIYPGMDMISLGATIENPHSPTERLYIPSIGRLWRYLVAFLQSS
jgi:dipeptidase D